MCSYLAAISLEVGPRGGQRGGGKGKRGPKGWGQGVGSRGGAKEWGQGVG